MRPAQELEADPDDPFGEPMPPASEGVEVWTPPQGWSAQKAGAAAAASILAEQESADPGSMAILCRTNANVQRTAAELARLGIPAQVIGGSQFYVRMETRDLANALEAVSNPGRRLSWLAMLRSPVVGLSLDSVVRLDAFPNLLDALLEQELPDPLDESRRKAALRWLPRLVERAGRISAWEALGEAAFESGLLERLAVQPGGRRRLANVRKLVQMAAESPDQGPKDFAEGLRAVQQIRSDEPDADSRIGGSRAVQVMTIHRSKGLEFDSVVLPDWSEVWGPRFGSPDSLPGMTLALPRSADGGAQAWRIHAWAQELEAEAAREELQRLAYVGMTRARRRLSLGLPTPGGRALVLAAQIGQWAASGEAGAPAVRSLADPEGSLSS
jgi:ATP-dependent helicase/nuclease subunit A